MTADLERELRAALQERADHVTPDRLRYANGPRTDAAAPRRSRWAVAAPVLAAACVLAIAVAIAVVGRSGGGHKAASDGGLRSLAGTSWRLLQVQQDGHAAVAIPPANGASVTFDRDRTFRAYDGLNDSSAPYSVAGPTTLRLGTVMSSLVGYVGHDAARLAAINGIAAITDQIGADSNLVSARRDSGRLTLAAHGYTLLLGDEAPVAASSSAPATGSSSSSATR
jgi:hypothetical protein